MEANENNDLKVKADSSIVAMLTTADNPFDPFAQVDERQTFDESAVPSRALK